MGFFDKVSDAIITAEMVFEKECRSFTCYGLEDITKNVEIKGKIIDKDNNLIQFSGNNHGARPGFGGDQDGRGAAENQDRTGRNIHRKIQLPQTGIDLKRHIAARTRHMKTAHGAALRGRMRCFFRSFMFFSFPRQPRYSSIKALNAGSARSICSVDTQYAIRTNPFTPNPSHGTSKSSCLFALSQKAAASGSGVSTKR